MQPNGLALPLLLSALLVAPLAQANQQEHQFEYRVRSAPAAELHMDPPELPDLSGYTKEAVLAKIPQAKGKVVVRRMLRQDALKDFTGGNERLREWIKRQQGMPMAIFIEGGLVTAQDIAKALPDSQFAEQENGVYLARLPIVVAQGAALHVSKDTRELRLSQERGSFLVNDGLMFITDTRVTGWREADNGPATLRDDGKEFRPFLVSWGGSELYIAGSVLASLGYANSKSYGVSITQYTPSMHKRLQREEPTGWLIDSEFIDHWYGFYCYEAQNVVIKGNTYRDNIVYGIDPHDRSHGLIIAENTVFGTKQKHGIIISREVNDSWIINNESYDNKLSGIVIDRSSEHNLIAYNRVYNNHADGITLYESGDNLLWGNQVLRNQRHGIRVRNSENIRLYDNLSALNQLTGVYGHIKDLSDTDRDLDLDPFDTKISMIIVGGTLAGNGSSPINIDSPLSVELYRVKMLAPRKSSGIQLAGILGEKQDEILDLMVRQRQPVLIDPIEPEQMTN